MFDCAVPCFLGALKSFIFVLFYLPFLWSCSSLNQISPHGVSSFMALLLEFNLSIYWTPAGEGIV